MSRVPALCHAAVDGNHTRAAQNFFSETAGEHADGGDTERARRLRVIRRIAYGDRFARLRGLERCASSADVAPLIRSAMPRLRR